MTMPYEVRDSMYRMLTLLSRLDICRPEDDWHTKKGVLFTLDDCNVFRDHLERLWYETSKQKGSTEKFLGSLRKAHWCDDGCGCRIAAVPDIGRD